MDPAQPPQKISYARMAAMATASGSMNANNSSAPAVVTSSSPMKTSAPPSTPSQRSATPTFYRYSMTPTASSSSSTASSQPNNTNLPLTFAPLARTASSSSAAPASKILPSNVSSSGSVLLPPTQWNYQSTHSKTLVPQFPIQGGSVTPKIQVSTPVLTPSKVASAAAFLDGDWHERDLHESPLSTPSHISSPELSRVSSLRLSIRQEDSVKVYIEPLATPIDLKPMSMCHVDEKSGQLLLEEAEPSSPKKNAVSLTDFHFLKMLGRGAFGKVYLCSKTSSKVHEATNYYAIKVLRKTALRNETFPRRERDILCDIRHPFIVRLHYAFQSTHKLYLCMEYVAGGELFQYLAEERMISEQNARFYVAEVLLALEYLHEFGIIYRDIKPENILLATDGHIRLSDFGLSKLLGNEEEETSTICGTTEYMAPEVILGQSYDKRVDFYSVGVLLHDMLTGKPPYQGRNKKDTKDLIVKGKLKLPPYLTPDAADLLRKLLKKDPLQRLGSESGAQSIKEHRFFKKFSWDDCLSLKITPPHIPQITRPDDVSHFNKEYTSQTVLDTPVDETPLSASTNDRFKGFSFVAASLMERSSSDLILAHVPNTIDENIDYLE